MAGTPRTLAIRSISADEAEQVAVNLRDKYPKYEFEVQPHETRFKLVLMNADSSMIQTDLDKMARTANGLDPIVSKPAGPKAPAAPPVSASTVASAPSEQD